MKINNYKKINIDETTITFAIIFSNLQILLDVVINSVLSLYIWIIKQYLKYSKLLMTVPKSSYTYFIF